MKNRIYFILFFSSILIIIGILIFFPIYSTSHLIFPYSLHPFDLCTEKNGLWKLIKLLFFIFYLISSIIISNLIYMKYYNNSSNNNSRKKEKITNSLINSSLNLFVGYTEHNSPIYLCEKSLYQNILITGTIGTGKTSSAMYPFTRSTYKI
jgi:hypothetical protein